MLIDFGEFNSYMHSTSGEVERVKMFGYGLDFVESYLPGVPSASTYGYAGALSNSLFGPNWVGE